MAFLFALEIILFLAVPLLAPLAAAAPSSSAPLEPSTLSAASRAPYSSLATTPGSPPADLRLWAAARRASGLRRVDPRELGVVVAARSALVIDPASGEMLYEKNPDEVQTIASLTKLLTALVFLDTHPDWLRRVTIEAADRRGGGVEYFLPGETVTVRDVFYVTLVASSNTAAAALARSTGLATEEFVERMRAKAAELGMNSATVTDVTGLDQGNRASARDVARLASAAFDSPEIAAAVSTASYTLTARSPAGVRSRTVRSTDLLLASELNSPPYRIRGGKTGTLGAATGYHLALNIASDEKAMELLIVVLGSDSNAARFADTKALAHWSFGAFVREPRPTSAVSANPAEAAAPFYAHRD